MKTKTDKVILSLQKVDRGIAEVFSWKYPESWEFILWILNKREKVLRKTLWKLKKLNESNFINWSEVQ